MLLEEEVEANLETHRLYVTSGIKDPEFSISDMACVIEKLASPSSRYIIVSDVEKFSKLEFVYDRHFIEEQNNSLLLIYRSRNFLFKCKAKFKKIFMSMYD